MKRSFLDELRYIFSKQYQKDIKCLELEKSMIPYIKLKCDSESIDTIISRLKKIGYESNCSIKIGEFDDKNPSLSLEMKN